MATSPFRNVFLRSKGCHPFSQIRARTEDCSQLIVLAIERGDDELERRRSLHEANRENAIDIFFLELCLYRDSDPIVHRSHLKGIRNLEQR